MTSTTPPWRSLDAPAISGEHAGTEPPSAPSAADAASSEVRHGVPVRLVATIVGAIACGIIGLVLASSSGGGTAIVVDGGAPLVGESPGAVGDGTTPSHSTKLVVEVVGAVREPGVYRLPTGARVADLIGAAGGYGTRVDTARAERELNLAAPLRDGDQVRVPSRDDPGHATPAGNASTSTAGGTASDHPEAGGPVDLNQATAAELDALAGIGPVTAEKILASRAESPFISVDDLRTRGLVGQKTFDKIRASLVVR